MRVNINGALVPIVHERKTAVTKRFYRMYGGGCRRLLVECEGRRWRIGEHPYNLTDARACRLAGTHPHNTRGRPCKRRKYRRR